MRRALFVGFALSLVFSGHLARGDEAPSSADQLFKEAKALRDQGQLQAACDRFSESYRLESGVGVGLYLGDCYQRLGRTASAWSAFRDAQRIADERGDHRRAAIARKRADTLQPHVRHVTVAVDAATTDAVVSLDNHVLGAEALNVPIPADPGDHVITLNVPGQAEIVRHAQVGTDADAPVVHLEAPPPPPPLLPPPAPPPLPPVPPEIPHQMVPPVAATLAPAPLAQVSAVPSRGAAAVSRRGIALALLGMGAIGFATGAGFLALKNQSMTNGSPSASPQVDEFSSTASIVGFSIGGAALAAAAIVYLGSPTPHASGSAGLTLTPVILVGGEGAVLSGRF